MKILIIRTSSFSNIAATIPLIKSIKNTYPDAQIDYLSAKPFEDYLKRFAEINTSFLLAGDTQPLVLQFLKIRYDFVFDFENNSRTYYITTYLKQQFITRVKVIKHPNLFFNKLFRKKSLQNASNISSIYWGKAAPLMLNPPVLQWHYPVSESEQLSKDDLPTSHSLGYYVIQLTQAMQPANVERIIAAIKFPVILIGDKIDFENAENIKKSDPFKIYNACGKFSEAEQVHILKNSKVNGIASSYYAVLAVSVSKPIIIIGNFKTNFADIIGYASSDKYNLTIISNTTANGLVQALHKHLQITTVSA
jgi:ADP-heptose:LPS heptosyltransferase